MSSPMKRTLEVLRAQGYIVQVVEYFNYFSKKRVDLFGVIDAVAVRRDESGVFGIQVTDEHVGDHKAKMEAEERVRVWLQAGNRLELWSWRKLGKMGKRKLWKLRAIRAEIGADGNLAWIELGEKDEDEVGPPQEHQGVTGPSE